MLVIIIAAFGYFVLNKNDIARQLIDQINSQITGSIEVKDINLDPFIHFPNVSLRLQGVAFYDTGDLNNTVSNQTIFALENAYVSFDFWSFLQSEYVLDRITIQNGTVHLIQNEDDSFNLEKALAPPLQSNLKSTRDRNSIDQTPKTTDNSSREKQNSKKLNSESQEPLQSPPLVLNIDRLLISDVNVKVDMLPTEQRQLFRIIQSKASFKYVKDSIEGKLISSFEIDRLGINKDSDIENETLRTDLDFYYDRGDSLLNIRRSEIEFRNADFNAEGTVDFKQSGQVDLSYSAHDEALTFTRLFLTAEGFDNLRSGKIYLHGKAEGKFKDQIPNISCHFGASEMSIEVPKTHEYIRNIEFQGEFNSGVISDLSQAILEIDTVHAELPTGHVRASAIIRDFKDAKIAYDLDMAFRLENLAKFIDLKPLNNLRGRIHFSDQYEGELSKNLAALNSGEEEVILRLDDVSFDIPDVIDIDLLQGTLAGNIDTLDIDSLLIRSEASDILLNGSLYKLSHAIFEKDTLVQADLNIRSTKFDFPSLFRALPKTAASFPYVIRDLNLDVSAEVSFNNLENFELVPEMNFDLPRVDVRVDSLLNAVELRDGRFTMREKDSIYSLNFTNFKILSGYEPTEANFSYVRRPAEQDSMNYLLRTEQLKPYLFFDSENEILAAIKDTKLSGEYNGYIVRANNGNRLIKKAGFKASDFSFISGDTISAKRVEFNADDLSYKKGSVDTLWATLNSKNRLQFHNLSTSLIQLDSLKMSISTHAGIIDITPEELDFLGESDTANISINVIEDPMRFDLEYKIDDLPVDDILNSLYDQELLAGSVDVRLDIQSAGNDLETIQNYTSGSIFIAGDSLQLMGVDLDKFIRDFERSQTFNLIDLGAIVLVGPAGILYTKGSEYLVLLGADKGDTTRISRVNSQWQLDRGRIETQDVAFATLKNRVAMEGWLDLSTDSLDVTIAVINKKGCAIVDQRIYGNTNEPEYSNVNFFETLLAPVTNAVKEVVGAECKVFYNGNVLHPEKSDSQK